MRLAPLLLFLALASCATTRAAPTPGVPESRVRESTTVPALVGWLSLQPGQVGAFTLGRTIWATPANASDAAVLCHERAHVDQYDRFGVLLPVLYLASSFICWCRRNGFEQEAAAACPQEGAVSP